MRHYAKLFHTDREKSRRVIYRHRHEAICGGGNQCEVHELLDKMDTVNTKNYNVNSVTK